MVLNVGEMETCRVIVRLSNKIPGTWGGEVWGESLILHNILVDGIPRSCVGRGDPGDLSLRLFQRRSLVWTPRRR